MTDYLKPMLGAIDVQLTKDLKSSTRRHLTIIRNSAEAILKNKKAFFCNSCEFDTNNAHDAITHKVYVHDNMSGIPGWFCYDCTFRTLTYGLVLEHQKYNLHRLFRLNKEATPKPKEVGR